MFKLIAFLFTGCWHDWKLKSTHHLLGDGNSKGLRYMYTCTKCARHKKQDII